MNEVLDTVKEVSKNLSEVVKERLFSPMYFYFIIAWLITNWQFVFSLFAVDQKYLQVYKVDYLASFYQFDSLLSIICSLSKLIVIPAFSTWFVVWYLSILSEKFYKKTYQSKMNKETIKNEIDYKQKVHIAKEKRVIRDIESDKKSMKYGENPEFNTYLDEINPENIVVSEIEMTPSEVLYNTDYQAYVDLYDDYIEDVMESHFETQADIARGK